MGTLRGNTVTLLDIDNQNRIINKGIWWMNKWMLSIECNILEECLKMMWTGWRKCAGKFPPRTHPFRPFFPCVFAGRAKSRDNIPSGHIFCFLTKRWLMPMFAPISVGFGRQLLFPFPNSFFHSAHAPSPGHLPTQKKSHFPLPPIYPFLIPIFPNQ